jgi:hypothetical protein
LGYGFPIFFLKLSLVLAAAFHVSTTRYAIFIRASDLGGLLRKDESNGIRTRVLKLVERILFSEKDFVHAIRKRALS